VDLEAQRARITDEQQRVQALVNDLKAEFGQTESDESSELADYDQHPADSASDTAEREKDLGILDQLERELVELQAALERIDDGTYGIDENTGEPIDPARLEALPTARTNIES
jgi:RNA polymerase-binding transcription factor DksA